VNLHLNTDLLRSDLLALSNRQHAQHCRPRVSPSQQLSVQNIHSANQQHPHSAGVSGLTCALLLAKQPGNTVTVVAKHMPGDYDVEYTSPWAGANVLP